MCDDIWAKCFYEMNVFRKGECNACEVLNTSEYSFTINMNE